MTKQDNLEWVYLPIQWFPCLIIDIDHRLRAAAMALLCLKWRPSFDHIRIQWEFQYNILIKAQCWTTGSPSSACSISFPRCIMICISASERTESLPGQSMTRRYKEHGHNMSPGSNIALSELGCSYHLIIHTCSCLTLSDMRDSVIRTYNNPISWYSWHSQTLLIIISLEYFYKIPGKGLKCVGRGSVGDRRHVLLLFSPWAIPPLTRYPPSSSPPLMAFPVIPSVLQHSPGARACHSLAVRPDVLTRVSNGCIAFVQSPLSLVELEDQD